MMRVRVPLFVVVALAVAPAAAQEVNYGGAPQQGVDVQYRFTSPTQSQQILNAQPQQQQGAQTGNRATPSGVDVDYSNLIANPDAEVGEGHNPADGLMNLLGARGFQSDAATMGEMPEYIGASDIYTGITPDARDTLPHISPYQNAADNAGRPNQLTWLGFQHFEDKARVFIQTGRPSQYRANVSPDGMTITIQLRDTRVGLSNFRRPIDTSFYGTPVNSIHTERGEDGVTEVVVGLSRAATHEVVAAGEYLYIDVRE